MTKEKVYKFIVEYKQANDGLSPSMREIMAQGVSSTSMVDYYLKKLEQDGKISCSGVRGIKVKGGEWRFDLKKKETSWVSAFIVAIWLYGGLIVGIGAYESGEPLLQAILAGVAWPLFLPFTVTTTIFSGG